MCENKLLKKPIECVGCCGEQYWDDGFPRILYTRCSECINYTKDSEHHSLYYNQFVNVDSKRQRR